MLSATKHAVHAGPSIDHAHEQQLRVRVTGEFREMPGLTLTLAQAARLFSLDPERCERVLGALVQHGVLVRQGASWRVQR
jgi:selenocysteine lyase/cysteine desulfurase